jgi:hypothetical protein
VKHAILAVVTITFGVWLGSGHTPYFVALMLAAVRSDWRRAA